MGKSMFPLHIFHVLPNKNLKNEICFSIPVFGVPVSIFETGNLDRFGELLDEHWQLKRQMSQKMSNDLFDNIYEQVKHSGALGGKIVGAGGGGFFLVYCQDGSQTGVRKVFAEAGMREIEYRVDAGGTQVLLNRHRSLNTI